MKKILVLATSVLMLAACHNSGSSTVGEKDEEYSKSFEHEQTDQKGEHHAAPADQTHTEQQVDTSHAPQAADTMHH